MLAPKHPTVFDTFYLIYLIYSKLLDSPTNEIGPTDILVVYLASANRNIIIWKHDSIIVSVHRMAS